MKSSLVDDTVVPIPDMFLRYYLFAAKSEVIN